MMQTPKMPTRLAMKKAMDRMRTLAMTMPMLPETVPAMKMMQMPMAQRTLTM